MLENIDMLSIEELGLLKKIENTSFNDAEKLLNMILYGNKIKYTEIFISNNKNHMGETVSYNDIVLIENIDERNISYRSLDDTKNKELLINVFNKIYVSLKDIINASTFSGKQIFLNKNKYSNISNPIVLCSYLYYQLVVSSDYNEFVIINKLSVDYKLGEKVIEEMDKEAIYDIILEISKNMKPKQDSDKMGDKTKIYK